MHQLSIELTIPLIILVGLISSFIASMIGLGGGLVGVPLIMLIIGEHSLEAKLISYVSISFLSLFAAFVYWRQKRKPNLEVAFFILIGLIPITIICGLFLGPIFAKLKPYFHLLYSIIIIFGIIIVNFKDKIQLKKPVNKYWLIPIGSFIGFLSGTFGLSGGIVFVPVLVIGLKMSLKDAAVTSLTLKLVTSIVNVIIGASSGQYSAFESHDVYWYLPLVILIGAFFGSQLGPILNKRFSEKTIKIIFNILMSIIFTWEIIDMTLEFTHIL